MPGIGLILDVVIVVLLGATIFYAIRLSKYLDAFRSNRADMEYLIRELSSQITRAQAGVTALDDAAKQSGEDLQTLVTKARGMVEELSLMTEAGDNLAGRLENLATRNRTMVDELGSTAAGMVYPGSRPAPASFTPEKYQREKKAEPPTYRDPPMANSTFFAIRDPDFDRDDKPSSGSTLGSALPRAEPEPSDLGEHESQAERDLASALRRRRPRADH